jgi:hypothetical protein
LSQPAHNPSSDEFLDRLLVCHYDIDLWVVTEDVPLESFNTSHLGAADPAWEFALNYIVGSHLLLFVSLSKMMVELPAVVVLLEAGWADMLLGGRVMISFPQLLTDEFVELRDRSCF